MEQFFQIIVDYIEQWGYLAICIGMALESACIPVPSEIIFGFAGYMVYLGKLDFTTAAVAGVAGGLIGSVIAYLVGFWGGQPFVSAYGKYILLSASHVSLAQNWFDKYGLRAVFFSRLLPVVRTFISLPAGFAGVNFSRFIIYTVLGSIPWTIGLLYAGQLLGENWQLVNTIGHRAGLIVLICLIGVFLYYYRKRYNQTNS
ncbi:DedA family protein [Anaerospora sp.]|uniref:DedA family protein n=1 Tax=Anaerospora sp. TaxID=1960278 RepID=UPI00289A2E18|nr:DedA family protein [Anaerospora sp.]